MFSVRALLAHAGLDLTLLTGAEHADRAARWAHVIELLDPSPWLSGREIVLTTGLSLPPDDPTVLRRYVQCLTEADVAGLGFGVSLTHDRVPPALLAAAQEYGMPVFSVPLPTPFIAITEVVARHFALEQQETVQRTLQTHQRMTRLAVKSGVAGIVDGLATALEGWALLLDKEGSVLVATPAAAVDRLADVAHELAGRSATDGAFAISSSLPGGGSMTIMPFGPSGMPGGHLAVGKVSAFTPYDRLVTSHAISLISIGMQTPAALLTAERGLRAVALAAICGDGPLPAARDALAHLGFPASTRVTAVVLPARDDPAGLLELVENALTAQQRPFVLGEHGPEALVVLLAAEEGEPGVRALCEELRQQLRRPVHAGVGEPATHEALRGSVRQAGMASEIARTERRDVKFFREIPAHELLLASQSEASLQEISASVLASLREHDSTHRGDLLRSLEVFLRHDGRLDPAARELGVHRNTLRYRTLRIEEVTGLSLSSFSDRVQLWLALKAADLAG
jgi:purine catabolism regulator